VIRKERGEGLGGTADGLRRGREFPGKVDARTVTTRLPGSGFDRLGPQANQAIGCLVKLAEAHGRRYEVYGKTGCLDVIPELSQTAAAAPAIGCVRFDQLKLAPVRPAERNAVQITFRDACS